MRSSGGTAVTIRVPDHVLADIDAEAKNPPQFILNATRAALLRLKRERFDEEVGRQLCEDAEENLAIAQEFEHTLTDGIE